jgi:hypothetical protein
MKYFTQSQQSKHLGNISVKGQSTTNFVLDQIGFYSPFMNHGSLHSPN